MRSSRSFHWFSFGFFLLLGATDCVLSSVEQRVHLVASPAPLLSGSLTQCTGPDDPTCFGGVAAAAALTRAYSGTEPRLFLPFLDRESPFVQMSPLGWSVNRLIYEYWCNASAFLTAPSILQQNKVDSNVSQRDISDLQSQDLPLLLSNVQVPLGNSWHSYHTALLQHAETRLACMSIVNSNEPMNTPQLDTVLGGLDYIARINQQAGCYGEYTSRFPKPPTSTTDNNPPTIDDDPFCWIPILIFADVKEKLEQLIQAVLQHAHPPALILDVFENAPPLNEPRKVGPSTWLVSIGLRDERYQHHVLTLSSTSIQDVQVKVHDLNFSLPEIPPQVRDDQYNATLVALAELAAEARDNDPVVAPHSIAMPLQREGNYRRCKGGQCESGSLFVDALRWYTGAELAFATSGGFRGDGWPEGPVHISNLWDLLPFANNVCKGVMSGVSLFQLFNYSLSQATFEGHNTNLGGYLLQVSGLRLTYNTQLTGSRLFALDIWDDTRNDYVPVERLQLYKFATDSFVCTGFDDFVPYLNSRLVFPGEQAGQLDGSIIQQEIVAEYLKTLYSNTTYIPTVEGRMVNDTTSPARQVLNLVQTADSCAGNEFWNAQEFTCWSCPETPGVVFLKDVLEFEGELGQSPLSLTSSSSLNMSISFVNTLPYNVTFVVRSLPFWIQVQALPRQGQDPSSEASDEDDGTNKKKLLFENLVAGEQVTLMVTVEIDALEPGTATGAAIFGIINEDQYPGCTRPDSTFDLIARIIPDQDLNQLGPVRVVGWVASGIVIATALFLLVWVIQHRNTRIVRTLQPLFLAMIAVGVLVMGMALIPMGFDDEIVSPDAAGKACMAVPWLVSMGFTIAMSALFSKLWRINKLFQNSQLRRIRVKEKDVIAPFAILFIINFWALVTWTLVDPLQWERNEIEGQVNQSYGACRAADGPVSVAMICVVGIVNLSAFLVVCYQAYRARDVSDEFSESRNLGVALFSWVQLFLIGIPVLFLIDKDNPSARYFITAGLTFAVCMSMLLLIFVPILVQQRRAEQRLTSEVRSRELRQDSLSSANDSVHRSNSFRRFSLTDLGKTRISGVGGDMKMFADQVARTQSGSKNSGEAEAGTTTPPPSPTDISEDQTDHRLEPMTVIEEEDTPDGTTDDVAPPSDGLWEADAIKREHANEENLSCRDGESQTPKPSHGTNAASDQTPKDEVPSLLTQNDASVSPVQMRNDAPRISQNTAPTKMSTSPTNNPNPLISSNSNDIEHKRLGTISRSSITDSSFSLSESFRDEGSTSFT